MMHNSQSKPSQVSPRRMSSVGRAALLTATAVVIGTGLSGPAVAGIGVNGGDASSSGPTRGLVERVSLADDGTEPRFKSTIGAATQVSSNGGRFVVFSTEAPLVPEDTNGLDDVYLRDMQAGRTRLVSIAPDGGLGDNYSSEPSISADGRYVAFTTWASTLAPGDSDGESLDVVVKNVTSGELTSVSRLPGGEVGELNSFRPVISGNGRYVAFQSFERFSRRDDDRREDVYRHDMATGRNTLVSVGSKGINLRQSVLVGGISHNGQYVTFGHDNSAWVRDMQQRGSTRFWHEPNDKHIPSGTVGRPAISGNGKFVAFSTRSQFVVDGDSGDNVDAYRLNLESGRFHQVSVGHGGNAGNSDSFAPTLSYNGRFVGFLSYASNLVAGDDNRYHDAFRRDMRTGSTVLVSRGPDGNANERSGRSNTVSVSPDGHHVVFDSYATNLGAGDSNRAQDVYQWRARP